MLPQNLNLILCWPCIFINCIIKPKRCTFFNVILFTSSNPLHVSNRQAVNLREAVLLCMQFIMHSCRLAATTIVLTASLHECMIHIINCMYSKTVSWRWIAYLFETCRRCKQNKIQKSASRWFYYNTKSEIQLEFRSAQTTWPQAAACITIVCNRPWSILYINHFNRHVTAVKSL